VRRREKQNSTAASRRGIHTAVFPRRMCRCSDRMMFASEYPLEHMRRHKALIKKENGNLSDVPQDTYASVVSFQEKEGILTF
jgi:predicted TIM-barrel fold metal-dependent hydrolase